MMFITEEEAKERLESGDNALSVEHARLHNGGRRPGDTNIPPLIRELIGTAAHMGTIREVSETFGVSPVQVKALKAARPSQVGAVDENLRGKIESNLMKAEEIAISKLMDVMGLITMEDVAGVPVKGRSEIARNLSSIAKNSRKEEIPQNKTQVIIYAPSLRTEEDYGDVIEVAVTNAG